jgi:hypothetical protein
VPLAAVGVNAQTADEENETTVKRRAVVIAAQEADGAGPTIQMFHIGDVEAGGPGQFRRHAIGGGFPVAPRQLAEFGERFPNADADGDGAVSGPEREAYLTAAALSDSPAFLKQFPQADHDGNGTLDTLEAARAVSNPFSLVQFDRVDFHKVADEPGEMQIEISGIADGGGENIIFRVNGVDLIDGPSPSRWVQDNIAAEFEPQRVAEVQEGIRLARNAEFLEHHPEADTDGSGLLSDEEREVFEEQLMQEWLERIEVMPESEGMQLETEKDGVRMRTEGGKVVVKEGELTHTEAGESVSADRSKDHEVAEGADDSPRERAHKQAIKGDEWYQYTVNFIRRYQLTDVQQTRAFKALEHCYRLRDTFIRKIKIRDEAERSKRIEKHKREIFEKQLKPRLDRLPNRKQRQAAKEKASSKPQPTNEPSDHAAEKDDS